MKRPFSVLCALMVCVFFLSTLDAQQKTLLLAADEWAPFNMTPESKQEGYILDIVRAIFEPKGFKIDYRIVPWNRTLQGLKDGTYLGAIGASKSDAEGAIFPDEELAINRLGFFTALKAPWKYTNHESVNAVSLAVIDGYDYRPWLSDYIADNKKNPARVQVAFGDVPLEKNLQKLLAGRVDVVVDSTTAVRYTAKNLGVLDRIRNAGEDTEPALIYIAFSPVRPESPELANLLSDGIRSLRKSGQLKVILARYGLEDWKK